MCKLQILLLLIIFCSCDAKKENPPKANFCSECVYADSIISSRDRDTCKIALDEPFLILSESNRFTTSFCLNTGGTCERLERKSVSWLTFVIDRTEDSIISIRPAFDKEDNKIVVNSSNYEMSFKSWVSETFEDTRTGKHAIQIEVRIQISTTNLDEKNIEDENGSYLNSPNRVLKSAKCCFIVFLDNNFMTISEPKLKNIGNYIDLFGDIVQIQLLRPFNGETI